METVFTHRIKLAMSLRGKRPIDICENCGIEKGNLSRYINGKLPTPKIETVSKIAEYLNVSVFWLLGYADNMSFETREITSYEVSKAVGIEPSDEEIMKKGLIDDKIGRAHV